LAVDIKGLTGKVLAGTAKPFNSLAETGKKERLRVKAERDKLNFLKEQKLIEDAKSPEEKELERTAKEFHENQLKAVSFIIAKEIDVKTVPNYVKIKWLVDQALEYQEKHKEELLWRWEKYLHGFLR